jgi:hypothetical protein
LVSLGKAGLARQGVRLLCAALIALSGCTAVQIGYNNADSLLHWRGGQYFGFENEQKAEFERRVQRFLDWHRKTELPRYARYADDLANRLSRGVSQGDLVWGYDAFQSYLRQSLRAGAGELAALLDDLAPEQIEQFQERLEKENREFAKDYGLGETPEARREIRVKRNVKRMEDWFGSLSEAQTERIALYSRRAPLDDELRLRDRRRLQRELVAMLKRKEARKKLVAWAAAWDQNREPAFEALRKENLQEYYAMVLDLDKTLTPEQRGKAVRRLRGYAGDFTALASAAEAVR